MALKALSFATALAAAFAAFAGQAAPARAPEPAPRPELTEIDRLILKAGVEGEVSFMVADLAGGPPLEALAPDAPLPPASVAKIATALYALDVLRSDYRFETRVAANGALSGGVLHGDLILQGGGDPELDTVELDELAAQTVEAGVREVQGRFLYDRGPFPRIDRIDGSQPDHVAYNPAVSALNLNFNRVRLEWRREGDGHALSVEARADGLSPPTEAVAVEIAPGAALSGAPLEYAPEAEREVWRVSPEALGEAAGGRWLPVRRPALYAARTFRDLAAARGLALPPPEPGETPLIAPVVARHESRPLAELLRGMLFHSTNLTAETVGLAATRFTGAEPETLAESAQAMSRWARRFSGVEGLSLVDHSGLGVGSRATARALVALLDAAAKRGFPAFQGGRAVSFPSLLRQRSFALRADPGPEPEAVVRAKTGTLHFASALAGYVWLASGRRLAFAILSNDPERRAEALAARLEDPPGAAEYARRARLLQRLLLRRWIRLFGDG